jgi:hypothetical protein
MIVDVNVAHKVLLSTNDPDFGEVRESLFTDRLPNARIVHGGHLSVEYGRSNRIRRMVVEMGRTGRAKRIDDTAVDNEQIQVVNSGLCRSDDPHIIALARVSKVRLLCSEDLDLRIDFTNHLLISKPRGKIYKRAKKRKDSLLDRFCK